MLLQKRQREIFDWHLPHSRSATAFHVQAEHQDNGDNMLVKGCARPAGPLGAAGTRCPSVRSRSPFNTVVRKLRRRPRHQTPASLTVAAQQSLRALHRHSSGNLPTRSPYMIHQTGSAAVTSNPEQPGDAGVPPPGAPAVAAEETSQPGIEVDAARPPSSPIVLPPTSSCLPPFSPLLSCSQESQDSLSSIAVATGQLSLTDVPATRPLHITPTSQASTAYAHSLSPLASQPVSEPSQDSVLPLSYGTQRYTQSQEGIDDLSPVSRPRKAPSTPDTSSFQLASSPLLSPPPRRQRPTSSRPPLAPSHIRSMRDFKEEIELALEWNSEPMLSLTLLRNHNGVCQGDHALHEAIAFQHEVAVNFLLQHGHDIEGVCESSRPLMKAVRMSCSRTDSAFRMASLLLNHGANPNGCMEDRDGDAPIHQAAYQCHVGMVECLVQHGADVNLVNKVGRTALHCACSPRAIHFGVVDVSLITWLLEHGVDPRLCDADGLLPRELLLSTMTESVFGGDIGPLGGVASVCRRVEQILLCQERWLDRSPAILARGRGTAVDDQTFPLCALPEVVFRSVVHFL